MNPFEYLSVLVGIIIALGISHILASAMRLIRFRFRIRIHPVTLIWMLILFLVQMLIWWDAFTRRDWTDWTFFGFLLYILIPILVSVPGYLLVPENMAELENGYALQDEFEKNRRWFFAILGAVGLVSLAEYLVSSATPGFGISNSAPLFIIVLSTLGFWLKSDRAQLVIALSFLIVLLAFVSFVFLRLA
jgi:hypothetical protein